MKVSLNGALVRERRTAAGWSVPELARRLGVQAGVVWAIERGLAPALQQLPLAVFADLADLLDIQLTDLFAGAEAQLRELSPDAAMIEAVLIRYGDGLTREVLAAGLGWSFNRLDAALHELVESEGVSGRCTRRRWTPVHRRGDAAAPAPVPRPTGRQRGLGTG